MIYDSVLYKVLHKITRFITKIQWKKFRAFFNDAKAFDVTYDEKKDAEKLLSTSNYLILTQHKPYLTNYLIGIMTYVKTRKWPTYCHILMNVEESIVTDREGFDLMEATNSGVHWSSFDEVFDCDNFCILKPKNMTDAEWDVVMIGLSKQFGKGYDDLFNIKDSSHVSCVEMCLNALKELPDFEEKFPNLSSMIKEVGNLTPQMYRDCPDFMVVYETKH